jgi:predicted phage terminase large subunit-like protein
MIFNPGSLWDESVKWLESFGGKPTRGDSRWNFANGNQMVFRHLQHESNLEDWKGAQLAAIGFDELTNFTERMFFYMLSRARSMCGVKPYIRATTNPDPVSWVRKLLMWWIDPKTGMAIEERCGVVRWFIRDGKGTMTWADDYDSLAQLCSEGQKPMSFTFINSKVQDNVALMQGDPSYIGNLHALPLFERELLLNGNWNVRRERGMRFKREWFKIVKRPLADVIKEVRYWDRASTEPSERNKDPDHTAGVRMFKDNDGNYGIRHVARCRLTPGGVKKFIKDTARVDGLDVELLLEQDPGQAGVAERDHLFEFLDRYAPRAILATGSKWVRSAPLSAAAEQGRVYLLEGDWNDDYIEEMVNFCDESQLLPGEELGHDDQVDGSSGAFNELSDDDPRIY